ncbi:MAG: mechanosensitive ion channel [Marinagarivorans sp.]|nr:mechanosensitive ion channel [Marinagarivorans sp.]
MIEQLIAFFADGAWIDQVIPFLINVAIAIGIYVIGKWISGYIVKFIDKAMTLRKMDVALRGFIVAILGTLFTFVIALVAIEQLGVNTTSLLALLGAAGLAVGLALKDSLSNFAAGVMLILFKPFKIGDFVEVAGIAGAVESIEVFNSILKTGDNKKVIVPNSQIYGDTITNYSANPTRRVDLVIGISYGDDMKKARELIMQVVLADQRILKDPEAVVAVNELGESSVNIIVRPWVATDDYWVVRWALLEAIKNSFDANGISIPFPQRDVHIHQREKI